MQPNVYGIAYAVSDTGASDPVRMSAAEWPASIPVSGVYAARVATNYAAREVGPYGIRIEPGGRLGLLKGYLYGVSGSGAAMVPNRACVANAGGTLFGFVRGGAGAVRCPVA
jgi:hypothetical protein